MNTLVIAACCSLLVAASQAVPVEWANLQPRHITHRVPFADLPTSRIVGGTLAAAGDLPFQIGMFMDDTYFCGGSLIAPDLVLSAAHCIRGTTSFAVYLGSLRVSDVTEEGRVLVVTTDAIEHESYNPGRIIDDIGLIRLGAPVELNERIQTIRLTRASGGEFAGTTAVVSGWGQETDASPSIAEDLQWTSVVVMSHADCQAAWGNSVPDSQLCVDTNGGNNTPCFGDSGGPLTVTESDGLRSQIGVVSYVSGSGCESGVPSVFTRVSSYLDWVAANGGPAVRP